MYDPFGPRPTNPPQDSTTAVTQPSTTTTSQANSAAQTGAATQADTATTIGAAATADTATTTVNATQTATTPKSATMTPPPGAQSQDLNWTVPPSPDLSSFHNEAAAAAAASRSSHSNAAAASSSNQTPCESHSKTGQWSDSKKHQVAKAAKQCENSQRTCRLSGREIKRVFTCELCGYRVCTRCYELGIFA